MDKITLCKFDALGDQTSEGVVIEIIRDLPDMLPFSDYDDACKFYDEQADDLVGALKNNLPQGVLYRVLHKLMESYSKEVLFRGKTGK